MAMSAKPMFALLAFQACLIHMASAKRSMLKTEGEALIEGGITGRAAGLMKMVEAAKGSDFDLTGINNMLLEMVGTINTHYDSVRTQWEDRKESWLMYPEPSEKLVYDAVPPSNKCVAQERDLESELASLKANRTQYEAHRVAKCDAAAGVAAVKAETQSLDFKFKFAFGAEGDSVNSAMQQFDQLAKAEATELATGVNAGQATYDAAKAECDKMAHAVEHLDGLIGKTETQIADKVQECELVLENVRVEVLRYVHHMADLCSVERDYSTLQAQAVTRGNANSVVDMEVETVQLAKVSCELGKLGKVGKVDTSAVNCTTQPLQEPFDINFARPMPIAPAAERCFDIDILKEVSLLTKVSPGVYATQKPVADNENALQTWKSWALHGKIAIPVIDLMIEVTDGADVAGKIDLLTNEYKALLNALPAMDFTQFTAVDQGANKIKLTVTCNSVGQTVRFLRGDAFGHSMSYLPCNGMVIASASLGAVDKGAGPLFNCEQTWSGGTEGSDLGLPYATRVVDEVAKAGKQLCTETLPTDYTLRFTAYTEMYEAEDNKEDLKARLDEYCEGGCPAKAITVGGAYPFFDVNATFEAGTIFVWFNKWGGEIQMSQSDFLTFMSCRKNEKNQEGTYLFFTPISALPKSPYLAQRFLFDDPEADVFPNLDPFWELQAGSTQAAKEQCCGSHWSKHLEICEDTPCPSGAKFEKTIGGQCQCPYGSKFETSAGETLQYYTPDQAGTCVEQQCPDSAPRSQSGPYCECRGRAECRTSGGAKCFDKWSPIEKYQFEPGCADCTCGESIQNPACVAQNARQGRSADTCECLWGYFCSLDNGITSGCGAYPTHYEFNIEDCKSKDCKCVQNLACPTGSLFAIPDLQGDCACPWGQKCSRSGGGACPTSSLVNRTNGAKDMFFSQTCSDCSCS